MKTKFKTGDLVTLTCPDYRDIRKGTLGIVMEPVNEYKYMMQVWIAGQVWYFEMQVGQLYSCKWNINRVSSDRGWDMLMFLGMKGTEYLFYDILASTKCMLAEGLIKHCKEITLEEQCTQ